MKIFNHKNFNKKKCENIQPKKNVIKKYENIQPKKF